MVTQKTKMLRALKGTLSRASAGAMLALSLTGCTDNSDLELKMEPKQIWQTTSVGYKQRYLAEQEAIQREDSKREAQIAKIRFERSRANYDSPQTFTNVDGTIDRYFPIEDLLYNGRNGWEIFYTEKDTQKVKRCLFSIEYKPEIVRDLATNQLPFAEVINRTQSAWHFHVDKTIIHIRKTDRIKGGTEYISQSKNRPARTTKLMAMDLEGQLESSNGN